jgi:hypothetical protein
MGCWSLLAITFHVAKPPCLAILDRTELVNLLMLISLLQCYCCCCSAAAVFLPHRRHRFLGEPAMQQLAPTHTSVQQHRWHRAQRGHSVVARPRRCRVPEHQRPCSAVLAPADHATAPQSNGGTMLLHGLGDVGEVSSAHLPWLLRLSHISATVSGGDSNKALQVGGRGGCPGSRRSPPCWPQRWVQPSIACLSDTPDTRSGLPTPHPPPTQANARGYMAWRAALDRGLLPDDAAIQQIKDSDDAFAAGHSVEELRWPADPLRTLLIRVLAKLGVSRFAQKYPGVKEALLKTVLEAVVKYHRTLAGIQVRAGAAKRPVHGSRAGTWRRPAAQQPSGQRWPACRRAGLPAGWLGICSTCSRRPGTHRALGHLAPAPAPTLRAPRPRPLQDEGPQREKDLQGNTFLTVAEVMAQEAAQRAAKGAAADPKLVAQVGPLGQPAAPAWVRRLGVCMYVCVWCWCWW